MNLDDPNLTAYALDELNQTERAKMETAIAQSPEAQAFVRQTQAVAQQLRGEFRAELHESEKKPLNIMPLPMPRSFWSDARWMSIGVAALLAIFAVIAVVILSHGAGDRPKEIAQSKAFSDVVMEVENESAWPDFDSAGSAANADDVFRPATVTPISTFAIKVGTTSYAKVQRLIEAKTRPPKDSVRVEEMINHFSYEYPAAAPNESLSIHLDAASCPWQPSHRLARIGLKTRENASEASAEVEFDPAQVDSYRLLGYENATVKNQNSARDISAGYTTTAFYEIVPAAEAKRGTPLMAVRVHYRLAGKGRREMNERALIDDGRDFRDAPDDFKFAAAVAEFGMILRDSPHKGNGTLASVLDWSNESKGRDEAGYRAGFIELVRKAQTLAL